MCVAYSKMAFLNIWLREAQWVKILNSESFQLQLSIRQSLGEWHYGYKQRNKVTLIVCVIQIIDRKQKKLTTISEFGVAVPTSNFPNDIANIVRVFNIGSLKLLEWFNSQYPEATLKFCQKDEKVLAYSRELYLWIEKFQFEYLFRTFQTEMKFCSFLEKNRKVPQFQRKNSCWVVGARTKEVSSKIRQLSSILWNYSIFIVINQSDRPEFRKELLKITKPFSINGLFWWNFICTTKMISRAYIPLYFRNNNLLDFSQGITKQLKYLLHIKIRAT